MYIIAEKILQSDKRSWNIIDVQESVKMLLEEKEIFQVYV